MMFVDGRRHDDFAAQIAHDAAGQNVRSACGVAIVQGIEHFVDTEYGDLLAVEVGEKLGLSSTRLRSLAVGGLLHDVGKLSVPSSILQKPGSLDEFEFSLIKLHPERGRELLNELGGFDDSVTRLVLDHHERLDGTGYPRGLRSDDLDLETRILAVCDVYDALVSPRVYRAAWSPERAGALLRKESGTAFDPRCVQALLSIVIGYATPDQLAS